MTNTKTLPRQLIALCDDGAAGLFPGYFAVVMATGATSIASHLLHYEKIALVLLVANCLAYAMLFVLTLVRAFNYPRSLVNDMVDHVRGPGFFTLIAGTCILGTQFQILVGWSDVATVFWWLGVGLWSCIMYLFFISVTIRTEKPTLEEGINGAWLLAAVSTQSVAILTAIVPWSGPEDLRLFFALCMFMIGCMLYLAIITLIFYRLTFLNLSPENLSPPYWINMGAVAITTLAGSTLIVRAHEGGVLMDFLPFLRGFTLFFWSIATWWIPLLLGLTFWRHVLKHHQLHYEPQLWSLVFPLAMYTTGTIRLVDALHTDFLLIIPGITIWLAWGAWLFTSLAMWRHFARLIQNRTCQVDIRNLR